MIKKILFLIIFFVVGIAGLAFGQNGERRACYFDDNGSPVFCEPSTFCVSAKPGGPSRCVNKKGPLPPSANVRSGVSGDGGQVGTDPCNFVSLQKPLQMPSFSPVVSRFLHGPSVGIRTSVKLLPKCVVITCSQDFVKDSCVKTDCSTVVVDGSCKEIESCKDNHAKPEDGVCLDKVICLSTSVKPRCTFPFC